MGQPYLEGVAVHAEVLEELKGPKVRQMAACRLLHLPPSLYDTVPRWCGVACAASGMPSGWYEGGSRRRWGARPDRVGGGPCCRQRLHLCLVPYCWLLGWNLGMLRLRVAQECWRKRWKRGRDGPCNAPAVRIVLNLEHSFSLFAGDRVQDES